MQLIWNNAMFEAVSKIICGVSNYFISVHVRYVCSTLHALVFFFKITFLNNYTKVSDRLDTDLTGLYVGPDLSPYNL